MTNFSTHRHVVIIVHSHWENNFSQYSWCGVFKFEMLRSQNFKEPNIDSPKKPMVYKTRTAEFSFFMNIRIKKIKPLFSPDTVCIYVEIFS